MIPLKTFWTGQQLFMSEAINFTMKRKRRGAGRARGRSVRNGVRGVNAAPVTNKSYKDPDTSNKLLLKGHGQPYVR